MHQARKALALMSPCGARCRSGQPSKNVPVKGKQRCRMHGGKSPGAPIKHGQRTKSAIKQRREDQVLLKTLKMLAVIEKVV